VTHRPAQVMVYKRLTMERMRVKLVPNGGSGLAPVPRPLAKAQAQAQAQAQRREEPSTGPGDSGGAEGLCGEVKFGEAQLLDSSPAPLALNLVLRKLKRDSSLVAVLIHLEATQRIDLALDAGAEKPGGSSGNGSAGGGSSGGGGGGESGSSGGGVGLLAHLLVGFLQVAHSLTHTRANTHTARFRRAPMPLRVLPVAEAHR